MAKLFTSLTENDPVDTHVAQDKKLPLWGRTLLVPESSGSIARFSFADLCNKPLSAADYLEITREFGTIFVEDIPRMGLSERDQARRFITFIDGRCVSFARAKHQHATRIRLSCSRRLMRRYTRCSATSTAVLRAKTHM